MTTIADLGKIAQSTPIPTDEEPDLSGGSAPAQEEGHIYCDVCGKDITATYGGRGRKPTKCAEHKKSGGASKLNSGGVRGSNDVRAAVDTLESLYSLMTMGLTLVGAHEAAGDLERRIPFLNEANAKALGKDVALAKRINSMGQGGGRFGFFATQAFVLVPIMGAAGKEIASKREPKVKNDTAVPFAEFGGGNA